MQTQSIFTMTTQLLLNDLHFFAHHGVFKEETLIGGEYSLSIELDVDVSKAALSDELSDTINLQEVYDLTKAEMQKPSKLIENAAYRIVRAIKTQFPTVKKVTVTLHKINPPIGGQIKDEAVVISE